MERRDFLITGLSALAVSVLPGATSKEVSGPPVMMLDSYGRVCRFAVKNGQIHYRFIDKMDEDDGGWAEVYNWNVETFGHERECRLNGFPVPSEDFDHFHDLLDVLGNSPELQSAQYVSERFLDNV